MHALCCSTKALPFSQSKEPKDQIHDGLQRTSLWKHGRKKYTKPDSLKVWASTMDKHAAFLHVPNNGRIKLCWRRADGLWGEQHFFFHLPRQIPPWMVFIEVLLFYGKSANFRMHNWVHDHDKLRHSKMEGNTQSNSARTACWLQCQSRTHYNPFLDCI